MHRNIAQVTGVLVTAIIVFGTDMDVFYAMPLGIMAGALATFFVAVADGLQKPGLPKMATARVVTKS